jgi:2-polyprenyl-6-methoxyphenol hydroxylase-like FAD-dependent oxidoreductase
VGGRRSTARSCGRCCWIPCPRRRSNGGGKVASVEPESGTVKFADGSEEAGFDLIIGADGSWSKVRPVLTDVRPEYSGISGLSFSLWDAETQHRELWELVSKGSLFAWTNGHAMTCQQLGDGSLNIYAWHVSSEDWVKNPGFDGGDVESVKREIGKWYEGWNPKLQRFVSEMKEDANPVPRALYNLPIGHTWTHKRGVTLIGDAAHVMTPFAGEGVNAAMADALSMSKKILAALKSSEGSRAESLDTAVLEYEKEMFARVSSIAAVTRGNLEDMFLVPNSPRSRIEAYIVRNVGRDMNIVLRIGVTVIAYAYFGIWKLFH